MPAAAQNSTGITYDTQPTTKAITFDSQPTSEATPIPAQQPAPAAVTYDKQPLEKPSMFHQITEGVKNAASNVSSFMEEANPDYAQIAGAGKEAATGLGGLLNIVTEHAGGVVPKSAQEHMRKGAEWLKQQGELRDWTEGGGINEHMGAMGADYLGFEGLSALIGGGAALGVGGVTKAAQGLDVIKTLKQAVNLGETLEKFPIVKQALGIGLRTVHEIVPGLNTAATGGTQSYIMSGGDKQQAIENAIISGVTHVAADYSLPPLAKYIQRLKAEAEELLKPILPPIQKGEGNALYPPEPQPELVTPKPPAPRQPAPIPTREPAAARFTQHERQTAQQVTGEQLEDLNQYRAVDQRGTPTNIQQLGLPSRSATEPYQFHIPGWSATTEAGDLLHEAGARYKQTGTRVVEGKGDPNMKPWEMQQAEPFDLPRYAETPGAVATGTDLTPETIPPGQPAEPPSSPFSHKEPIMRATEYRTGVRPGSEIREATTRGGPSVITTDPEIAAAHLNNIETILQDPNFSKLPVARQADILQSHSDVMQQMREYRDLLPQHEYSPYLHQPTFEPLDVDTAMSRVADMGDAADEVMKGPKAMYDQWQDLTKDRPGGSFQDLNEEINDLQGKTGRANRQRLAEVQAELQKMFSGSDPYLGRAGTLTDYAIARAQFNHGYLVKRVDNAFTNAWEGANRTGEFDVSKLQSNWKSLVNDVGEARLSNTLGSQRYEAMNNIINDLAGEPALDKAAKAAAKAEAEQGSAEDTAAHEAEVERLKGEHKTATAEWKTRDEERKAGNLARKTETKQKIAAAEATGRKQWYYDLARNGWHHIATKAGMEGVASLVPHGVTAAVTAKVGAALVLKQIITHPLMAEMAFKAAKLGTKPAIYAPVIADIISSMHGNKKAEPQEP